MNPGTPSTTLRILAIAFCPLYLLAVATSFSTATDASLAATIPVVGLCAAAITTVLIAFGVKAYRHNSRKLRFNLGTVLLLMVPVSVYLMAFQQILHAVPLQEREFPTMVIVAVFSLLFACLSTAILLYFAEAILWFALGVLRWWLRAERNRY